MKEWTIPGWWKWDEISTGGNKKEAKTQTDAGTSTVMCEDREGVALLEKSKRGKYESEVSILYSSFDSFK